MNKSFILNELTKFRPPHLRNMKQKSNKIIKMSEIGGLKSAKVQIMKSVLWPGKYPKLFAQSPIRLRSGILLYGPPGMIITFPNFYFYNDFIIN